MPKVKSEIPHELGQKEALRRLKEACERARGMSDIKDSWAENVLTFSVSIQGVKISGEVEVTDKSLKLNGKIPIIALPFKSWIPNILKHTIKDSKEIAAKIGKISNQPLILYLHIPKAGGTTLGEFIYNQCQNGDQVEDGLIKNGVFFMGEGFFRESETAFSPHIQNSLRRQDLRAVMGHFAFGLHEYIEKPFQYLTILRHPVKRVISLFHYLELEGKMSLEDFANSPPYREIDNDQTRRIAGINPEIGKVTEKNLEKAKANLREHFAVVGTTERFDETLVLLKQKLNWTKEVSSFPRNVTNKKTDSISQTAVKAIENRNLFDLELHSFANQLMDEMIAAQGKTFFEMLEKQRALNTTEK